MQSKAFGGNREDYINKIKENRQVGACKVMRSSIAEYVPNEAVNQWIADVAVDSSLSSDVKNWLSAVSSAIKNKTLSSGGTVEVYILDSNMNKPSDELIKELKDTLDPADGGGDGLVPIGHCVHVQGAKLVNIDFDITVSLKQGYSVEDVKATVKDVIKSALTEYKNEWELNESTELVSIQFLTAIYNECSNYITNVSCTLNNGQSVTLDEISVATLGILKINDEELVTISRIFGYPGIDLQDKCWILLAKYNLKMLILTCGTNGSYVFTPGVVSYQDTPKVPVADTVGAGDSFTAAFTSAILSGKPVPEAHKLAVEVSAYVCTQSGAMPELPQVLKERIF